MECKFSIQTETLNLVYHCFYPSFLLLKHSNVHRSHAQWKEASHMGHFIIRGTFGVRQVTYAIQMKYFTIKTNSLFF